MKTNAKQQSIDHYRIHNGLYSMTARKAFERYLTKSVALVDERRKRKGHPSMQFPLVSTRITV